MRQRLLITASAAIVVAVLAFRVPQSVDAAILRNLRQGDRGEDIHELQALLNRDPDTRLAETGPGSPGNETEYFGPLTFAAVKRFQQKYALDILVPVGLNAPTGFVGPQTRLALLRLESEAADSGSVATVPGSPVAAPPTITGISPAVVTGTASDIVIAGANFTPSGNTVIFSSEDPNAYANLASADGKTLAVAFRFTTGEALRKELEKHNDPALTRAVIENIRLEIDGPNVTRVPVTVAVKNANGQSNTFQFLVDMAAALAAD